MKEGVSAKEEEVFQTETHTMANGSDSTHSLPYPSSIFVSEETNEGRSTRSVWTEEEDKVVRERESSEWVGLVVVGSVYCVHGHW